MTRRTPPRPHDDTRAVVVGAGMAGLLAARVLLRHFEEVVVLERDRLPAGPDLRPGVPQARHIHVLLQRGVHLLERAFPGMGARLDGLGVPCLDPTADARTRFPPGWLPRFRSQLRFRPVRRALIEWVVREALAETARLRVLDGREATGLICESGGGRLLGVTHHARGRRGDPQRLAAELVVDAAGRRSRAARWLAELGLPEPAETRIDAGLSYATRWFRLPPDRARDWQGLYVMFRYPDCPRAGVLIRMEGDRWLATLAGVAGHQPPADDLGFLEYAASLADPAVAHALRDADPLDRVHGYRAEGNRLRHFARLHRWPEGLVVLGDAACTFSPIYGQGMSAAAEAAEALDRCLGAARDRRDLPRLAAACRPALARTAALPWRIATGEDLRWATGETPFAWRERAQRHYLDRVITRATHDPVVATALLRVLHLTTPPRTLVVPRVLAGLAADAMGAGRWRA